ncbi:polyphenol oxidase family protein [Specibacter cremeus]|uniref:polyphenol oxidase family protein n=1 Tax=Specibacter cremeus TaxID=1629051 RepID=UPI000F7732B1|nr:polyphenol oxidase family protein [Specibacter cremeus]
MFWTSGAIRPGLRVGFTDSREGNLAFHVGDDAARVTANRSRFDRSLAGYAGGVSGAGLRYMSQVHGADVAVVSASDPVAPGQGPTADAMVTRTASLAVMVADCVPVVLVGSDAHGSPVLGVAHAGRPGVQAGVIAATMARLRAEGAVSVHAWIGPSVCGRCYEVPAAMRADVAAVVPEAYATTSWGTPALDLPAAVERQLRDAGASVGHVAGCTLETPALYSHRRALRDGEPEGRFAGFVAFFDQAL